MNQGTGKDSRLHHFGGRLGDGGEIYTSCGLKLFVPTFFSSPRLVIQNTCSYARVALLEGFC